MSKATKAALDEIFADEPSTLTPTPIILKDDKKEEIPEVKEEVVEVQEEEDKAELVSQVFPWLDDEAKARLAEKAEKLPLEKLFKVGIRESLEKLTRDKKTLENQLSSKVDTTEIDAVKKQLEEAQKQKSEFESMFKELEQMGYSPTGTSQMIKDMTSDPEGFRLKLKAVNPEIVEKLFTVQGRQYDNQITMENALQLQNITGILRDDYDSDEEFFKAAKASIDTLSKVFPRTEIDEDAIVRRVTEQVAGSLQSFQSDMKMLAEKLTPKVEVELPPQEEKPVEEEKQSQPNFVASYILARQATMKLTPQDMDKIDAIIGADTALLEKAQNGTLTPEEAIQSFETALEKYQKSKKVASTVTPSSTGQAPATHLKEQPKTTKEFIDNLFEE